MNLATTKINQDTPAKKVREELARITGRSEWVKQDYWAYFLVCAFFIKKKNSYLQ